MAPNNEPTLKGLPTELLDQVLDKLSDETILMLRGTSKQFDAATFDRFVEVYVANQDCWIYDTKRWKRLSNMHTSLPRLCGKMRDVTLASDWMLSRDQMNFATVPEHNPTGLCETHLKKDTIYESSFFRAAFETRECILRNELGEVRGDPPSFKLMIRMLRELSSYGCSLHLNLFPAFNGKAQVMIPEPCQTRDYVLKAAVVAVATLAVKLKSIVLSSDAAISFEMAASGFEPELKASFGTLERFYYTADDYEDVNYPSENDPITAFRSGQRVASLICRAAHKLQDLEVSCGYISEMERTSDLQFSDRILSATHGANLRSLKIACVQLNANSLLDGLLRFKSSLTQLCCDSVCLAEQNTNGTRVADSWIHVWRLCSTFPELQAVRFSYLEQLEIIDPQEYHIHRLLIGTSDVRVEFKGRDKVKAGLQFLIEKGLVVEFTLRY
ncbi:hypothetical protein Q7P37_008176 [Cladosporium fusiforme]